MGTNYYFYPEVNKCDRCGQSDAATPWHIGKSSGGWCFALHVGEYRDGSINNINDLFALLEGPGRIEDEYGREVARDVMRSIITDRNWGKPSTWSPHDYVQNDAQPGPNGLVRHKIGLGCVGHGAGTWDYIDGDFS